jgi:cytochrome c biogenesis factor
MMALGGLLAASDRRYRATRRATEATDASGLVSQRA